MLVFYSLQLRVKNENLLHLIVALCFLAGMFYCHTTDYFASYGMMIGYFLAAPFEKKFVNFEGTKSVVRSVLRVLGGGVIYIGLNNLLKMPFPKELLASATMASFLIRAVRYGIVIFVLIGVYPMIFNKIGKKKK